MRARAPRPPRPPRPRPIWFLAVLLAACEHGGPFRPATYTPDGPFNPSPPIRLTLNPGPDRTPVWLPGGHAILYTAARLDRTDHDRCFAILPGGGGAISRYACRTTASDDSTNVFEEAAPAVDGRLAFVRVATHRLPGLPVPPDVQALVVATLVDPNGVRVLRPLAYTAPSGNIHQGISHVHWLDTTRLVYLAERVVYPRACSSCVPDTVRTGIEIVTLDFAGPTPVLAVVPGTDSASSVAVGATGDTIYFTRNGDSRVYRYAFSSGQAATVHDFGAAGIARDVTLRNGRLLCVLGGDVAYGVDPILGPVQYDNGGLLYLVALATGVETVIGDTSWRFRRPAVSPDGARVVAERWAGVNSSPDLWLLDVPSP